VEVVACWKEILRENKTPLSRQTSVIELFKSSSRSLVWPTVLLDNGDGEPSDIPTVV
jgi:hypothetical protein